MFKRLSLPMQLVLVIGFVFICGGLLPLWFMQIAYTSSIVFKEFLSFLLPFIVFSFVLSGIMSLKKNAPVVLLILISTIFASNFLVALSVYGIMKLMVPYFTQAIEFQELVSDVTLEPLVSFHLPSLIRSEYALLAAIVLGLFFSFYKSVRMEYCVDQMRKGIENFLLYCFIPFLPVYVLGFLLKLRYEGLLVKLATHYGATFFLIVVTQSCYLLVLYLVAAGFSVRKAKDAIINAIPSYLTAFGTMSSTLTVPVSIESAVKNTSNRALANIAMPIMANVHLLGDSIGTPILAMVTMYLFFGTLPTLSHYISFVFYFCTAMFAVSGIPGGGILVMIPVLVSIFNFTPAMVSIVTTLYFLLDPFGTAANVMGDGALVMIVQKFVRRFMQD